MPVPGLRAGWSLARAAELLAASGLPLLPVTTAEGRLEGTLSREEVEAFLRDAALAGPAAGEDPLGGATVAEAMDPRPVTALPGDGPAEAAALLARYALPALAVTDREGRFLTLLLPGALPPPSGGSPPRP